MKLPTLIHFGLVFVMFAFFFSEFPLPSTEFAFPLKKVKSFIYCVILMKFETQCFYMFNNNNWDRNLLIRAPLPPGGFFPPPPSKSKILHLLCDFDEIWNTKFSCLPIIIRIEIYDLEPPHLPGPLRFPLKKVKFFIYGAILLKYETKHLHMFANNNWD